ncbi:MAG: asparagine synthase (glutamine-hydrolyzing) [Candidatus Levybacteria bacterium CG10_big_fil_rev_8_21_14_0_10_36_7]|nr:MAG: asparagine synthase (glutamine-hydrolyzing) [Candidatus Levybacteria bacterium CG10_big_fil_rev_8_21_14_0_10_36_7]
MCGILGIVGKKTKNYTNEDIKSALSSLSKRGPDDQGVLEYGKCILGQTRLSIIDLSSGHQPMKDNQKDIAVTYNGEIYNYQEIKEALEDKGHIFSTNSDTEVILKSYIEYGDKCLEHFEGMFAFAIWDNEKQELFIARDRFGKKPFYYAFDECGNFIFASEIKALFSLGKIKGDVDFEAIDNFMRLLYIPPYKSIYKNIHTLKPAHYGIIDSEDLNDIKIYQYWKLEKKEINISYAEAKEKIKGLFGKSVQRRMISDVEVGSMLSGGVDSTLISYEAQKYMKKPLKTFSVGFGNFINELPFAKEAAEKTGSDHNELIIDANIAEELKKVYEYLDEPIADAAVIPTYLISKLAKEKNTKVLLSGDGADELFLGYGWYVKHWNIGLRHKIENFNLFPKQFKNFLKSVTYISDKERKQLWKNKKYAKSEVITDYSNEKKLSDLEKINTYDLNMYLPGDLLPKIDRASMMMSVETRCPFLDKDLVEFVYNIPTEYKTDKKNGKIILKDILGEIMPEEFVNRNKQGFGPPINNWLEKKEMKKLIYDSFVASEASVYSFLNKRYIQKLINKFYNKGDKKHGMKVWIFLCLELWLKNNKKYHV